MNKSLLFGLDYDETYTASPAFFDALVMLCETYGHKVVLVTNREGHGLHGEEVRMAIGEFLPIVFAGSKWKRDAAKEAGYEVDIWIDDTPQMIAPQYIMQPRGSG